GGDYGGARLGLAAPCAAVRRRPTAGASAVPGGRPPPAPPYRPGARADRAPGGGGPRGPRAPPMSLAPPCRPAPPGGWAVRGFNPHHRKARSYYPLLAHVAQTGHILRVKNRPGNVHDSTQSAAFLRELIDRIRGRLGRRIPLEFRMDAAFFQPDVLR